MNEDRVIRFIERQTTEFVKYLREKYPNDQMTKNLLAKFSGVQLLTYMKGNTNKSYISGLFDHATGVLKIAPRDSAGNIRDEQSLNKSIVHELAHATRFKYIGETSHSNDWKTAWKKFLKIATEDLGWKVESNCSSQKFYGLTPGDCPNCVWDNEECDISGGQLA